MDYAAALIFWVVVFGAIGALIGPRKGYEPIGAFGIGAIFGIFGVAYLAMKSDVAPLAPVAPSVASVTFADAGGGRGFLRRVAIVIGGLLVVAIAAALLGGLTADVGRPTAPTGWTRSAAFTTCQQWIGEMSADQRVTMARSMLPPLRAMVDSAATNGLEMAPGFANAITVTCQSPAVVEYDEYQVSAAAALAFLDTDRFQPK